MTIDCSLNWPEIGPITGPCIRPGGPTLTERALQTCCLPTDSHILDIGCGAGGTLEYLERIGIHRSLGLDKSEQLLGQAVWRLQPGRLICGTAETLPFKNDCFDAVFCECVLSILSDRMAAFLEFDRVLKEGGFLIVSDVFDKHASGRARHGSPFDAIPREGLFAREDLWDLLSGFGFSLLLWEEYERLLKEFVARLILAGEGLPESWRCRPGKDLNKKDRKGISYFLMVARKQTPLT